MLFDRFSLESVAAPAGKERDAAFDRALAELVERREEFREQGYVPRDFVHLLKEAGIYRSATPATFGGDPEPPAEFMRRLERISEVDPSTGWVAAFGSALTYLTALPRETQQQMYAKGLDIVFAGGFYPLCRAQRVDGGWVATGTWTFASGCMGADIIGLGLDGGPEAEGKPLVAMVPPQDVEFIQDWDVTGMRASGSFGVKAEDLFIPDEMTFLRGAAATVDEPVTRYPVMGYAAQVHAATALGAARAALDLMIEAGSSAQPGKPSRGDRADFQLALAHAEAELRSARALFYETTEQTWEKAVRNEEIPLEDAGLLRVAATHAAQTGASVAQQAFRMAGTSAIFATHPLQQLLQDAVVPAQHAALQENTLENAGAVLMGMKPALPAFP
ncbi:acyl-CoA dehydrogenase family protein [Corynebacterium nuruki]|jgi:alkylation response protein AidB-like acyl-CoA dehydrogenase|uniref:acyl-CoA dehydrogenase family protein n=1 Tax=Corynebacterium nuruki TaxID=1032851 RepID=UPI000248721A|nr:acyl-CoA dehydrogenase family protein [Corynebacterium nuruki]